MNKRQVIVLWIVAIVLVAAVAIVNSSKDDGYQSATERQRGETLLPEFQPTEVASIRMTRGDQQVTLSKGESGWTVAQRDDYPADVAAINTMLRTLEEVEVTQGIEADPEFAPRFGMDPEATEESEMGLELVLANDGGSEIAHLTFGKNLESAGDPMSPFGGGGSSGRFVRNHGDSSGIYVTSELFSSLDPDPSGWLADDFLQVEKISTIAVSKPGDESTIEWKLTRADENADFTLEGKKPNEELDTTAINPLKNLFSYARFEDVVPADQVEAAWDKEQRRQAVIETVEGFTYNVTFGPEKSEGDEASQDYLMRVTVTAELPAERKKPEGETEDAAKAADEAFAEHKKALEEKLEVAKQLEGRTFRVTKYTVDALLKDRTGLIKSATPANTGATTPAIPGMPGMPAQPGTAPQRPPRRPAQAVTPPIAIPPLPEQEESAESEAPEEPAEPAEPDSEQDSE